ncbi:hypothetical protein BJV82DRAFT_663777 [Fennellomyces sp. T-0311]|nr:hypothetical protein BJV82DRAFT_663777 [Fennellomyces sp. T-0311]
MTDPNESTVDPVHLADLRARLEQYRQRHSAVLKKELEQERIEHAEAETRKRLQALLEAEQQQPSTAAPAPSDATPSQFLSNAFAMVSEKDAIKWLKSNPSAN